MFIDQLAENGRGWALIGYKRNINASGGGFPTEREKEAWAMSFACATQAR